MTPVAFRWSVEGNVGGNGGGGGGGMTSDRYVEVVGDVVDACTVFFATA